MTTLPTLFLSHGAPDLVLDGDAPAHRFLAGVASDLPRPVAIVVCSAHWEESSPMVGSAPAPTTIHDFGGFAPDLHRLRYAAPGSPDLARRIAELLHAWPATCTERGFDHGVWVPLLLAYPAADIPVVPVSLLRRGSAADHLRLGQDLATLRHEGVLVIGSGSATHNLGAISGGDAAPSWVSRFDDWLVEHAITGDTDSLVRYRSLAPDAAQNHPTAEHLMPLLVALGAAGTGATGRVLHRSTTYGVLRMTACAFG